MFIVDTREVLNMPLFQTKLLFETLYSRPQDKPLSSLLFNFSFFRKTTATVPNNPQESGIFILSEIYPVHKTRIKLVWDVHKTCWKSYERFQTFNLDPVSRRETRPFRSEILPFSLIIIAKVLETNAVFKGMLL